MSDAKNNPFTEETSLSVASISETELIQQIRHWLGDVCPPSPAGIGDDCAVTEMCGEASYLLTTIDGVAWGEHFDHEVSAQLAGRKLMGRNLSDIASMGGVPRRAVVSLWLSPKVSLGWLESFYRGISELAQQYGVEIVGGDVSRAPEGVFISDMCLQGGAERPLQRRQVMEGDSLWVTGTLGGSILGKHVSFDPRIREGQWLNQQGWAKSMMDVSDGLAKDLPSLVGSHRVELNQIPVSAAALELAKNRGGDPWEHALCDGEDFELLFAVDRSLDIEALQREWMVRFPGLPISRMGQVGPPLKPTESCLIYIDPKNTGDFELFKKKGYEHF